MLSLKSSLILNLIVVKIVILKENIEGCPNILLEEVNNYSQVMSYDVCYSEPIVLSCAFFVLEECNNKYDKTKVKNTKHYKEGFVNNYLLFLTQDWDTLIICFTHHKVPVVRVTCFMCYLLSMYDNNRDRIGIT